MSFGSLKRRQVLAEGTGAGAEELSHPASSCKIISKSMPGWSQAWNGSHSQQVQGGQVEEAELMTEMVLAVHIAGPWARC